jgi:hypothetical protein
LAKAPPLPQCCRGYWKQSWKANWPPTFKDGEAADNQAPNRRNGYSTKKLKTSGGTLDLSTPRDRAGSFEPELVRKRQTILGDALEERILGMYGLGMSLRDISSHIEQMYDVAISHTTLSEITDYHPKSPGMAEPTSGTCLSDRLAGCDVLQSQKRGKWQGGHLLPL